ncbi:MAG: phage/plasmid primase, P4 family [Phycisphaeraceae bacterium]
MSLATAPLQSFHAIPAELRALPRWVLWRWQQRKNKRTKVPFQASGAPAKSTDPATWTTFESALSAFDAGGFDGIGFALGDGIAGIDLDSAIDEAGILHPWAREIVNRIKSYTEVSPSGRGLHIIVRAQLPAGRRRKSNVEMYDAGRYFCMTGKPLPGTVDRVEHRGDELHELHRTMFGQTTQRSSSHVAPPANGSPRRTIADADRLIIETLCEGDAKTTRLWAGDVSDYGNDRSRADLALCNRLIDAADGDRVVMDQLFRQSGLMRPKWNENRGGKTYGQLTIDKALAGRNGHAHETPQDHADHLSDIGNAARFAHSNRNRLRFLYGPDRWLVWDDTRWKPDDDGTVVRMGKQCVLSIYDEAKQADEQQRERIVKHALRSERRDRIAAMIDLARPELAAQPDAMDADPFLFNVMNGTIDLRTGALRPHSPDDRITKLAPVAFDAGASAPLFTAFLHRTFAGDADLIAYVQRVLGMALTSDVREQHLWIFLGDGANGKSTLLDSVCNLMGDYSAQAPPTLFSASKQREHATELADLMGRRLIVGCETEDGAGLRLQLVKQLTGNARIKARFMRQDYFEFQRTHKLILMTNNRPVVSEDSEAVWRRIRLVPFNVVIPEAERDAQLLGKLQSEAPGILNWLVAGCLQWQRAGLQEPPAVVGATREYRSSADNVAAFVNEQCILDATAWTASADLMESYEDWCEARKERAMSSRAFHGRLPAFGCKAAKQRERRGWFGVRLNSHPDTTDRTDTTSAMTAT